MSSPRTVVVVNPQAQSGALGRRWPTLNGLLRRELGPYEEALTTAPGDATRLTRAAVDAGADTVVAIGGDGTIGEVAAGFFDGVRPRRAGVALGVVPFGTGGDFRRSLALSTDLATAARVVRARKLRTIDVGHLRCALRGGGACERLFVNIASFGLSGEVDALVNRSSKRLGGRLTFLLATARAGLRYKNQRVRLIFDDATADAVDTTINTVAVANGRYFGGGMFVAPEAELDDGQFDVIAIGDLSRRESLLSGQRLYAGTHLALTKVSSRRAHKVHAEALGADAVALDVDGETPGILPATFQLIPRALQVIAP